MPVVCLRSVYLCRCWILPCHRILKRLSLPCTKIRRAMSPTIYLSRRPYRYLSPETFCPIHRWIEKGCPPNDMRPQFQMEVSTRTQCLMNSICCSVNNFYDEFSSSCYVRWKFSRNFIFIFIFYNSFFHLIWNLDLHFRHVFDLHSFIQ